MVLRRGLARGVPFVDDSFVEYSVDAVVMALAADQQEALRPRVVGVLGKYGLFCEYVQDVLRGAVEVGRFPEFLGMLEGHYTSTLSRLSSEERKNVGSSALYGTREFLRNCYQELHIPLPRGCVL